MQLTAINMPTTNLSVHFSSSTLLTVSNVLILFALRGFGFVIMAKVEDSERALQIMDGHEVDGRPMKVEKARRKIGYDKTPGKC